MIRPLRTLVAAALFCAVATSAACSSPPPMPAKSPAPLSFDDGSQPDYGKDMVACLSEGGWPVSLGTDGGFKTSTIPEDQLDLYQANVDSCLKSFGYDKPVPALSDDQLKELYPHVLWEWKCLDERGYGPEAPPSEQSFVDFYHNNGGTWTPYSQFTSTLGDDELNKLLDACPRSQ
ncbi:hypothetical protein [Plantibacter flavus]|uniref:hypothetical protein n=1 Tax=Plantibacter flavus TaxID=150123 RepID=UPI0010C21272|nr:hypothetical protein [Plantibacter flavus]